MVVLLSGCIYSIELAPPYERIVLPEVHQLDVSVSLGNISSCFMQKCRSRVGKELDNIDHVFQETVSQEQFFTTVLPQGSKSDLYVDVIHYPDISSRIPQKRSLYRDLLTITGLGFVTPLPYPFYLQAKGVVQFRAEIDGESIIVKEYTIHFENTIWAASIIGARYKRHVIQDRIVRYLVPVVIDYMKRDYAFFKNVEQGIKAADYTHLKQLGVKTP